MAGQPLTIRIVGSNLPGSTFGSCAGVRVGLQVGNEHVGLVDGGASGATWEADVTVVTDAKGDLAIRGPAIHGPRGERFLYLAWVAGRDGAMFRRAKLQLDAVPAKLLNEALRGGRALVAELSLSDARGAPVCASVRPPAIRWSVERGSSRPRR